MEPPLPRPPLTNLLRISLAAVFFLGTSEGDKVLVIDVNSTNGTIINGNEIKAMDYVELPIGGEVIFGEQHRSNRGGRRTVVFSMATC